MTTTEIKTKINELDNEMFSYEMADRMTDEERKAYDKLLAERNELATKLYHMEHPAREEEKEEWFEPISTKEEEREEADKSLTLKLWNALKDTNWVGLPVIEKKMREKGWM